MSLFSTKMKENRCYLARTLKMLCQFLHMRPLVGCSLSTEQLLDAHWEIGNLDNQQHDNYREDQRKMPHTNIMQRKVSRSYLSIHLSRAQHYPSLLLCVAISMCYCTVTGPSTQPSIQAQLHY